MVIACPVCDYESAIHLTLDGYLIYRCGSCGHGFLHPVPTVDELKRVYTTSKSDISNSNAFTMLESYRTSPTDVHSYYRWFLQECRSIIGNMGKDNPRILDLGCSCGVFLRCLKDLGYSNVQGIEINTEAARAGSAVLGVTIRSIRVEDLEPTEKYDLITAFALLEHLQDPGGELHKLKEHLSENGCIFFLVPNFTGLVRTLMGKKWLWYMPPYHLHHFTIKSIRIMAEAERLKVVRLKTINTGSYLYLVYHMLFGGSEAQLKATGSGMPLRLLKRLDTLARFCLAPVILACRLLNKEAHIVGVLQNSVDDQGS